MKRETLFALMGEKSAVGSVWSLYSLFVFYLSLCPNDKKRNDIEKVRICMVIGQLCIDPYARCFSL